MALSIKHAEADRLARELSSVTGETLTDAVVNALRERVARQRSSKPVPQTAKHLLQQASQRLSQLPIRDSRSADEIPGYDVRGLPK